MLKEKYYGTSTVSHICSQYRCSIYYYDLSINPYHKKMPTIDVVSSIGSVKVPVIYVSTKSK
jgi:hypothetical protein